MQNKNISKKPLIIHPFLISSLPVLFLLAFNAHELPLQDVLIPIIISIVISFIIWIILRQILNGIKAGLIISAFILLFSIYGHLKNQLIVDENEISQFLGSNLVLGSIFLIIGILALIFFIKTKSHNELNSIFNVIVITIVTILILNIGLYYVTNSSDSIELGFVDGPLIINEVNEKPDVFVFILDEFAGEKQLQMDFEYDLKPFRIELEKRDFVVPKESFSNYPNTEFSLPSFLNMNYLDKVTVELGPNSTDKRKLIELANRSYVMQMFDLQEYYVTTFYGGLGAVGDTLFVDEKLCSYGTINGDLRKNFVLTYLPISYFNKALLENFQFDKLECVFSYIQDFKSDKEQPHFIFAHLRLPHDPFIFDSQGNQISTDPKLKINKNAYLEQLIFTERKILELIDSVQKQSPDAVIIIHSDHGFRGEINWEQPTDDDLIRGFNIMSAIYFPNNSVDISDKISLVNLYRILFNTYFDTNYEILEDKHFWYESSSPYVHIDVTDRLNSLT